MRAGAKQAKSNFGSTRARAWEMPRTYTRAEPDARRQSLIEAAARVLAERGAAGASVRVICAEAGVSPGLLRHYFDGIDALIAETYAWTDAKVGRWLDEAVAAAGPDQRAPPPPSVTV